MNRSDDYVARENLWDQQWPSTDDEQRRSHAEPEEHETLDSAQLPPTREETDVSDELEPFPDVVGTTDAIEAVRDAEPYTPAIDPPVLPSGDRNGEGISVATGFGLSADEEAATDPVPRNDDDIREQAILALRQDSLTSRYPLAVAVRNGEIRLRGRLPSVDDVDHATWLLGELPGVVDVIDETELDTTLA